MDALRLLLRHWPVLFALMFGAVAAHEAVLRAAGVAARWHPVPAILLLPLAAGCLAAALLLMLRTVGPPGARRGIELVPFTVVYFSTGLFASPPEAATVLSRWLMACLAVVSGLAWLGVRFWNTAERRQRYTKVLLYHGFGIAALVWAAGAVVLTAQTPAGQKILEPVPQWAEHAAAVLLIPAAWLWLAISVFWHRVHRVDFVQAAFFVLAYAVLTLGGAWLWELERLIAGPQHAAQVAGLLPRVNLVFVLVLTVCFAAMAAAKSGPRQPRVVLTSHRETDGDGFGSGWGDEEDERLIPA